jgi:DNA repair protein RecN (Recombination protein N)
MIQDIQIRDLGVISDAELTFHSGFTVLTGETGAGKTMVLTALGLLLGERSDSGAIRAGSEGTSVSGTWQLPEGHAVISRAEEAGALVDDGVLILSRQVSSDGRSKAIAGGRSIPVGLLSEIGQELVIVHGQSDQIRLKSPVAQRIALDKYAGQKHLELLSQYSESYKAWQHTLRKLEAAKSGTLNREREIAELTENLEFLSKLKLQPNEDVELADLAQKLTHTEQLRNSVGQAHEALTSESYDSVDAIGQLGKARKALESAASYDSKLESQIETLRLLTQQLNDVAADLAGYLSGFESDSKLTLDEIQERRALIATALRRFGPTLDDVFEFEKNAVARLTELDSSSESIESLEALAKEYESQAVELAKELTKNRLASAAELSSRITAELKALAMAGSSVHVEVESTPELGPHGGDQVSFLMRSYEGAEPRPIGKSASGGELSRIMLAIEVILAESESASTFIFDEVDAGVGGAAAIEVGRRLAKLARGAQVIVVTHLAQVAAFADNHLSVIKETSEGFTSSDVKSLVGEERVTELARMLSGLQDSDSARGHASELLDLAKQI